MFCIPCPALPLPCGGFPCCACCPHWALTLEALEAEALGALKALGNEVQLESQLDVHVDVQAKRSEALVPQQWKWRPERWTWPVIESWLR